MPSSGTGKKRIPRCSYSEGGRRCVRNAAEGSNPALCNAHRVLFQDMGRPPSGRIPGQGVVDVLSDLLSGQRVTKSRAQEAINELFSGAWDIGGIMGGYMPGVRGAPSGPAFDPFAGLRGEHRAPPPPIDYEAAQLTEARRRARIAMGFAATEPVTRDQLKARHRELVRKHHPDLAGGDEKKRRARDEKMRIINAAHDVLEAELAPPTG